MKTLGGLLRHTSYLTERQLKYVKERSEANGISESAFIASLVQRAMTEPLIASGEVRIALEGVALSEEAIEGILERLYNSLS